ncbi:PQQ-binding-like beta-propeller repeat protein [Cellulomonas sp. ICMP 17802]|uniref:outer membrane protein assembly factor BamB family protein n=1 Tax=Cellulomonas sp. ICMP 17802 TaxID=3239199 RepID=UPI00351BDB81
MTLHTVHLAPVELDDADGVDDGEAPSVLLAWLRTHALSVAGAAAVVALGLLGAQSAIDTHERERLAYLADVPGVLSPLHDPLGELWQWAPTAGSLVAGDTAGRWAIGARYHSGGVDLRGTDPDTGRVLWSVPFSLDAALPAAGRSEFPSVWVRCTALAPTHDARAVCGAEVSPVPAAGAATPLLVLDPTRGTVLASPVVEPGSLWSVTGRHLVVAKPVTDDGGGVRWTLTATDPTTGSVAWRRTTPVVPSVHEVHVGSDVIRSEAELTSDDGRVLLTDSGHAWLFGGDGSPRGDVTVAADGWAELARADTLVWSPWRPVAVPAAVLVTRDGSRVAVGEMPATPAVDDGSAPDVVLLSDGTDGRRRRDGNALVARDATTGDELWRTEGTSGDPILVDGVVYVAHGTEILAQDARTGDVRWRARIGSTPVYLGTDGTLVIVVTANQTLRGLDLADGSPARAADVARLLSRDPGGVDQVSEYAGRLLIRFLDGSGIVVG